MEAGGGSCPACGPALELSPCAQVDRRPQQPRRAVAGLCLWSYQRRVEASKVLTVSQTDPWSLLVPGDVKCARKDGASVSSASPQPEGE